MVLASALTIISVLLALGIGIRVMLQNDYRVLANLRSSTHSFYYSVAGIEWGKNELAENAVFPPAPSDQTKSFASGAFAVTFSPPSIAGPLLAQFTVRSSGTTAKTTHLSEAQLTKTYDFSDAALAVRGNPLGAVLGPGTITISGADHQINGNLKAEAKPRLAVSVATAAVRALLIESIQDPAALDGSSLPPLLGQEDYLPADFIGQLASDLCSAPGTLMHSIPATGLLNVADQIWGSQSSPELHCVDGLSVPGDAINFSGNVSGVGILVVRNADCVLSGSFRWQGLVIVHGQEIGLKTNGPSTKDIVGATLLNEAGTPASGTAIFDLRGNFRLLFSREALVKAAELIPQTTLTNSYPHLPSLVLQKYWRSVAQ